MPSSDLTLKDIEVLVGNLKAIHNKLSNKDSGAISKLEAILEKIDPVVINLTAKKEKDALKDTVNKIELLVKSMQTEVETITAKYSEDTKELAETLIGESVKEVLSIIEKEKINALKSISSIDIEKKIKMNYLILSSSIIVSVAIGYLMGSI